MPAGLVRRALLPDLGSILGLPGSDDNNDTNGHNDAGSDSSPSDSVSQSQSASVSQASATDASASHSTTTVPTTNPPDTTTPPADNLPTTTSSAPPQNTLTQDQAAASQAQQLPQDNPDSVVYYTIGTGTTSPTPTGTQLGDNSTSKGFFENKTAVIATFTILGIIGLIAGLYFLTTGLRSRRAKRLDREIAEAAAIREGFGGFGDDDDRVPFHRSNSQRSASPGMVSVGTAALASRPSTSHSNRENYQANPNPYAGYSGYPQYNNAYYNPQPPVPAVLPSQAFGQMPPAATYGPAAVQGMPRYAQVQAMDEHRRTPSADSVLAPPAPVAPARQNSVHSVQENYGKLTAGDLKVVN